MATQIIATGITELHVPVHGLAKNHHPLSQKTFPCPFIGKAAYPDQTLSSLTVPPFIGPFRSILMSFLATAA